MKTLPDCYRCHSQPCVCKDGITLYWADCYASKYRNAKTYAKVYGDSGRFDPRHLLDFSRLIVWGGNCFASSLPDNPGWLAWIKTHRNGAKIRQAEAEFAWTNCVRRPQCFRTCWIGAYKDLEAFEPIWHPTQKTMALMRWCLQLAGGDGSVLDPYAGSGTTGRACKDLGRKCIMVEIEEKYCRIAANRLKQEVLF